MLQAIPKIFYTSGGPLQYELSPIQYKGTPNPLAANGWFDIRVRDLVYLWLVPRWLRVPTLEHL